MGIPSVTVGGLTSQGPLSAAPTELGLACGLVLTMKMALLTELDAPLAPKILLWSQAFRRF